MDAATLDSEGRCLVLEFPAFVLIAAYCPANSHSGRDEFRVAFLDALDARIRNLAAAGKRVVLTGDINIIREEIDTANAKERLRKEGMTVEQFFSTPARRFFNQLVEGGKVYGGRDAGREKPVLVDICREFHPDRTGMFTCWEQRKNARPGNYGSRIDYVCVSPECREWFCDSNIQEGLMGSDHCPVYAVIKDKVLCDGREVDIRDIMNPPGVFRDGKRTRDLTAKDLLPISAKLIPEFDKRRSIKDMFMKKPALPRQKSSTTSSSENNGQTRPEASVPEEEAANTPLKSEPGATESPASTGKRSAEPAPPAKALKRSKTVVSKTATAKSAPARGQSSLAGFFKPKAQPANSTSGADEVGDSSAAPSSSDRDSHAILTEHEPSLSTLQTRIDPPPLSRAPSTPPSIEGEGRGEAADPVATKESWSKLLGKRVAPRCEHDEPCIMLATKKAGVNCGRHFFMCARPLGPSGGKERGTQWRCGTFIWSSDWNGGGDVATG